MKYNNYPLQRLIGSGMLYFVQQFRILADLTRELLYFVQDFDDSYQTRGYPKLNGHLMAVPGMASLS